MNLILPNLFKEIASLLYWTMLAACTVGPGTVVTCARAGAEYGMSMIWALVFASILAYILQEGTARLSIVSGKSLGQCLRIKYRHGWKIYETAIICWLVGLGVFFGNTLYECNNWAGGIAAILSIPGAEDSVAIRVGCSFAYAVIVLALLYWDKVDMLGIFLGIVMMAMAILFLVVVAEMDINLTDLGWGFVPNIPGKRNEFVAEPTDILLSLVGTTSIGFNLFLGGAMAMGKELKSAQRGIGFSTATAFIVSVLILIVGTGKYEDEDNSGFSIGSIAEAIGEFFGQVGVIVFSVGFIAAAISSMLTVPLGAALTADSVFSEMKEELEEKIQKKKELEEKIQRKEELEEKIQKQEETEEKIQKKEELEEETQKKKIVSGIDNPTFQEENGVDGAKVAVIDVPAEPRKMPRWIYLGIMFVMVTISTVVISANADRAVVILIAQVFNGCLLPFFSICLLVCINDENFMASSPQTGWSNVALIISVGITLFLASNVLIQKIVGTFISVVYIKLIIAACIAVAILFILFIFTSLGRDILRSFRLNCWSSNSTV